METDLPSFSRLAFGKAISNTRLFFGRGPRDVALAILCFLFGFSCYWYIKGLPTAMDQAASVAAFTLAPLGLVVLAVFLWNLFLAPCELAYEAARANFGTAPTSTPKKTKPVNWEIWKQLDSYSVDDLAAIIAKRDPLTLGKTTEEAALIRLLIQDANAGRVQYKLERLAAHTVKPVDGSTKIKREDAIKWAESKNMDVSHIR